MDERRIRRNQKMREEFKKAYETGLRTEIIVDKLSHQYALATLTIEAIVFRKGVYKEA